jgi:hypothetical protein
MPKQTPFGAIRDIVAFTVPAAQLAGTSATVIALSVPLGFSFEIESVSVVATTALAGGGGTRTITVRKGNASGTAVATLACTVAALGTSGNSAAMVVTKTSQTNRYGDADTMSVTVDSGGTAITSGQLDLLIVLKERPQA